MLFEFDKIVNYKKLGNKGKNLCILRKNGFNVPNGFVLDSDTYDLYIESEDKSIILNTIKGQVDENTFYAVRSSSSKEDTASFSFAGQYETTLNVKGLDNITTAVIACYDSLRSQTVTSYLKDHRINRNELKMSVVIQEMVDSDYSGVAFTVDPKTGSDKTILIEAVEGLGESLVSGMVNPESYSCNWFDGINSFSPENKLISSRKLQEMIDAFLEIQMLFGYPCDIEFAVKDDSLSILQARAITRIGYAGIQDVWTTADFKDGGVSAYVCTPYMWSLYEYIWDYALKRFVLDSKILKPADVDKAVGDMFYGRPYWNLTTVKEAMSSVPGYKEREFDSEYGIKITYEGDGDTTGITLASLLKIADIALAQKKILKEREDNAFSYKNDLLSIYYNYLKEADEEYSGDDLIKKWNKLTREDYLFSESTYFRQIFINTIHQSLYKDGLLKYVSESDYLGLLGGIDNISHLLPFYEMWETSRRIRNDKEAFEYWTKASDDEIKSDFGSAKNFIPEVLDFIDKFGYHSDRELDVTYPCYYEDVKSVIRMFRDSVALDDSCSPIEDKKHQRGMYLKQLDAIKSKVSASKFKKIQSKVEKMRSMLWWREEFRDVSTRFYYIIRVYTMKLASHLVSTGVINSEDDIWMLKVGDLWNFFEKKASETDIKRIVVRNKKYYISFRNFTSENEIGSVFDFESKQAASNENGFFGLGCNNGSVTAVARVVENLADIGKLKQGDILVTKYTDTGWTSKFAMLSGIVTEYGGILCHAAIVSREYGIPCIVCAHEAMSIIQNGSRITINGSTGEITLCEGE